MNFLRRLFAKIDRSGECWIWTGGKHKRGYGQFFLCGKNVRVSRIIWEIYFGPIPKGLFVLHKCDNPPCCNPFHLFLGTQQDNVKDMYSKDRGNKFQGEKNPSAKLATNDIVKIREMALSFTDNEIAIMLKLPRSTVYSIVKRKKWAHIP